MTLYHYTPDKRGVIKCTAACAKFWPPLVVPRGTKPKAGAGISAAKLSTVKRPDGTTQVTYAGFPLYRYSGDTKAGDVKGQGFQGVWHAVTSAGTLAKASGVGVDLVVRGLHQVGYADGDDHAIDRPVILIRARTVGS